MSMVQLISTRMQNVRTHTLYGIIMTREHSVFEPLWTDPGLKSEICVRGLISIKKKKRAYAGHYIFVKA